MNDRASRRRGTRPRGKLLVSAAVFVLAALAAPLTALAECPTKRPKRLSPAGLKLLINAEGGFTYFRTVTLADGSKAKRWVPYNDSEGNCTVGHGHLVAHRRCTAAMRKTWTITDGRATELLAHDALSHVSSVNKLVTVPLTQAQFDGLVDFVYNAGVGKKR